MKVRVWLLAVLALALGGIGPVLADDSVGLAPTRLAMGMLPQSSPLLLVGTVFRDWKTSRFRIFCLQNQKCWIGCSRKANERAIAYHPATGHA